MWCQDILLRVIVYKTLYLFYGTYKDITWWWNWYTRRALTSDIVSSSLTHVAKWRVGEVVNTPDFLSGIQEFESLTRYQMPWYSIKDVGQSVKLLRELVRSIT